MHKHNKRWIIFPKIYLILKILFLEVQEKINRKFIFIFKSVKWQSINNKSFNLEKRLEFSTEL